MKSVCKLCNQDITLEMWANAQRDGRPVEYRWRPLFNAAVWLTPTNKVPCSYAAKTLRCPLTYDGVPRTAGPISDTTSDPSSTSLPLFSRFKHMWPFRDLTKWQHCLKTLLPLGFIRDCHLQ